MIKTTAATSDPRLAQLKRWAASALQAEFLPAARGDADIVQKRWEPVSGDASFRRYFRTEFNGQTFIVMDAPPDKEAIAPFVDIAGRLLRAGVHAPQVFAQNIDQGFLLLEDLGDQMLKALLQADNGQRLFDQVLPVLAAMAGSCDSAGLPSYSASKLHEELDLFTDWYVEKHCGQAIAIEQRQQWQGLCQRLVDSALAQPKVFVHRDFHSCNLHTLSSAGQGDLTGVIDFQDAVCGPLTYDLASWLWDRYITWPRVDLERWMEQARQVLAPELAPEQWQRWCDLMGMQRNLKIVGIFARLHYRDAKPGYLAMIPRFADYLRTSFSLYANKDPEFAPYQHLLTQWLPSDESAHS